MTGGDDRKRRASTKRRRCNCGQRRVTNAAGKQQTLAAFKGKPVVVNFWASWCGPCVEEMPALSPLHREYEKKGITFIGLGVDSEKNVKAFLQKVQVDLPGVRHRLRRRGPRARVRQRRGRLAIYRRNRRKRRRSVDKIRRSRSAGAETDARRALTVFDSLLTYFGGRTRRNTRQFADF